MEKKIYVLTKNCNEWEWEEFLDELKENENYKGIIIDGNKRLKSFNEDFKEDVIKYFENYLNLFNDNLKELCDRNNIKNYFECSNDEQIDYIIKVINKYYEYYNELNIISFCDDIYSEMLCDVLKIKTNKEYVCGSIESQYDKNDWNYIFYPKSLTNVEINCIKDVYFGNISKYLIAELSNSEVIELQNNANLVAEYLENNFDMSIRITDSSYNTKEDLKNEFKKYYNYKDLDEVMFLEVVETKMIEKKIYGFEPKESK